MMPLKDQVANLLPREATERIARAARLVRDRRLMQDESSKTPSNKDALFLDEVVQDVKRMYPQYFKNF